ncbi:MAG: lysylphosphatidylglycerol synthase transmembrane domain-containing protein [Candidatus Saccharimonadales bacterium]
MSEQSFWRRRWMLVVNLVTLAALVLLVYLIRDQISDTFHNVRHVNAWALLLLIPVEALNYDAQARLYRRLFAIVGNKLSYKQLYKTSVELNFVNHVFPSGGVTGISYFTLRLRDGQKLSSGKATLIHVMKIALYFLAFEVLLVFGVLCLAAMGRANNLVILVAGSLSTLLLVGTAAFAYIIGSQQRINSFFVGLTRALNRLIRLVRPRYPETISIDKARATFDDFHENYKLIKSNYQQLRAPFLYALIADATEVLAIYVVYIAFGEWVNIGAVILAYGIANFAGLVSVLPGGVGIYEALMTTVLAATGVPPRLSLPVTVMYRVLNSAIQLPPGYYLYHKALRHDDQSPRAARGN